MFKSTWRGGRGGWNAGKLGAFVSPSPVPHRSRKESVKSVIISKFKQKNYIFSEKKIARKTYLKLWENAALLQREGTRRKTNKRLISKAAIIVSTISHLPPCYLLRFPAPWLFHGFFTKKWKVFIKIRRGNWTPSSPSSFSLAAAAAAVLVVRN